MQKIKRTLAISIVVLLTISIGASTILLPTTLAHDPSWKIPTYAYIQAMPNPVAVNQQSLIIMWLDTSYDSAEMTNNYRFHDYKLTITAPDDTITTQTFETVADSTSSQGYTFTPTQSGTYTLNFTFPGQTITTSNGNPNSDYLGDTYLPSTASTTLTVQETPLPAPDAGASLPTEYWTRPIYGENSQWYTISSNWLGLVGSGSQGYGSNFPGDAVGPQTSHIMWTKPLQSGGVVGGNKFALQGDTYFQGSAYADRFNNPIILDGRLYYTEPLSFAGVPTTFYPNPYGPTVCVDLRTGELIWSRSDIPTLSFGYIYDVQTPNQHGVYLPMLFAAVGSTWQAYDAYTGDSLFNVTNIPQGPTSIGVNGEYLIYVLTNAGTPTVPQYYLGQWNSSNLWAGMWNSSTIWDAVYGGSSGFIPAVVAPIQDGTNPALYDWNISIPSLNTETTSPSILDAFCNNMLICLDGSLPVGYAAGGPLWFTPNQAPYTYFAVNLDATRGAVGSILWSKTVQPSAGNLTVSFIGADPTVNDGTGVFYEYHVETMQWVGYSMATGAKLWGPVGDASGLAYYNNDHISDGLMAQSANGKLYYTGYGGLVYCYDLKNGNLLWTYGNGGAGNSTSSNTVYPGVYPTFISSIGNGILYLKTAAHTLETPLYKGALARALNATTGEEIWTISAIQSEVSRTAIADGYATLFNGYDNSIYSIGKGPSVTTVSAPNLAAASGQSVVVSGTVTDISAGTTQTEQTARFPNGVPCASDTSMTEWMSYVYQQQEKPTNFTGVTVTINVIDANGNYRTIGTAITDSSGSYGLQWTPDIAGKYTVIASFAGSNGYNPSNAQAYFAVDEADTSATPQPTQTPSSADLYFVPVSAGLFIAIVIVIALILLVLRKRP